MVKKVRHYPLHQYGIEEDASIKFVSAKKYDNDGNEIIVKYGADINLVNN